jgi:hypothetical protein
MPDKRVALVNQVENRTDDQCRNKGPTRLAIRNTIEANSREARHARASIGATLASGLHGSFPRGGDLAGRRVIYHVPKRKFPISRSSQKKLYCPTIPIPAHGQRHRDKPQMTMRLRSRPLIGPHRDIGYADARAVRPRSPHRPDTSSSRTVRVRVASRTGFVRKRSPADRALAETRTGQSEAR